VENGRDLASEASGPRRIKPILRADATAVAALSADDSEVIPFALKGMFRGGEHRDLQCEAIDLPTVDLA
jgi:hypothetical protein